MLRWVLKAEPGSPQTPTVRSPPSTKASPSPVPAQQTPASRSPVPPNCALEPATESVPFPNCGTPSQNGHDQGGRINLGLAIERAVAILASLRDDSLAATCAGIVQAHVVTPHRVLPQVDRTAERVAERLGPDAYQAAYTRGATLAPEKAAPTLLAELDDLLATTDAATPTGHT